jgi:COP9 signalosome complex subunit 2
MSDDEEYEYDYGSDMEEEEEEEVNDGAIEIENKFYEAEDLKSENAVQAMKLLNEVIALEQERGTEVKYRFQALQHLVTINVKLGSLDESLAKYRAMLEIMSLVTPNERTDAINVILDSISTLSTESPMLCQMYEITLEALKGANNARLWFNTNQKLAKIYIDTGDHPKVEAIIKEMKAHCQLPDGTDDSSKGTYLLEVYNLEIQLCAATRDAARMRLIYPRTLNLNASVSDPRVMGLIREEGGKMYMSENNWGEGLNELSEAFRAYQEAGNPRAKTCLKYVVLASMLALSDINPLAAPEAKVFVDDKEILAMSELQQSLEANDLMRFEKTLRNKNNKIIDEPFLMEYIDTLRRRMREQVIVAVMKPYKRVKISFLALELKMADREVEDLLVDMILDEKLHGARLDQLQGLVNLGGDKQSLEEQKIKSLRKWAKTVGGITDGYHARISKGTQYQ